MTRPLPSSLSTMSVVPYSWMVWGQEIVSFEPRAHPYEMPFRPQVRLHAARYADVRWERVTGRWNAEKIELSASISDRDLVIIEGEHWRGVLEGLYRKWAPSPTGDLYR